MGRPYVQIQADNKVNELTSHLKRELEFFQKIDGVIGITLNGGMARGYADHLSEIDITLYLDSHQFNKVELGKAPITIGITKIKDVLYDIKVLDYNMENNRSWNDVDLWDNSYAKILYDPYGKVKNLFRDKLSKTITIDRVESILFDCWWHFKLAGDIWIYRDDALQGHMLLNKAVVALVKALFIINKEYIPHEKWLIHMSRTLNWLPNDWETKLNSAMSTGDLTIESLIIRQKAISDLYNEVDMYLVDIYYPDLPVKVMQRTFYELLTDLYNKKSISIDEWKSKASLNILNKDPFRQVIRISGNFIILDQEKLLCLTLNEMYAWQYEIVEEIKK